MNGLVMALRMQPTVALARPSISQLNPATIKLLAPVSSEPAPATITPVTRIGSLLVDRPLRLSDVALQGLGQIVATGEPALGTPRADSRSGNLFTDGGDATRRWFLPTFSLLPAEDPLFAFAAIREGADEHGNPFNSASLTLGLAATDPDDVVAFRAANPDAPLDVIPLRDRTAALLLDYRDDDGSVVTTRFPGQLTDGGPLTLTFDGLLGRDVLLAFSALTAVGGVRLEIGFGYDVVRFVTPENPRPFPRRPKLDWWRPSVGLEQLSVRRSTLGSDLTAVQLSPAALRSLGSLRSHRAGHEIRRPDVVVTDDPPQPLQPVHQVVQESVTLDIGSHYAPTPYRPRYTLQAAGSTRVITERQDLADFDVEQSEYIELTTLGPISARYPSLQAVYLGQVTGTVIAVPAAYGIERTEDGCAVACDAVVDTSQNSLSRCRFHLTFSLLPLLDGTELLRLAAELAAEPSLAGRVKRVLLPSRLAPGNAADLSVAGISGLTTAQGHEPESFLLAFDVADADVPAVVAVNLLLRQLASTPLPTLLGHLRLALDDALDIAVTASLLLSLGNTSGGQDVAISTAADGAVTLTNLSALPLTVTSLVVDSADGTVTSQPVELTLQPDASTPAAVAPGVKVLGADAQLSEPADGFDAHLGDYVEITVANVQQMRHTVGVNAAGLFAGAAETVTVTVVLDREPSLALPTFALTPATAVQQTVWQLPLSTGVTGMPATVSVSVQPTGDAAAVIRTVAHDFALAPILTLTTDLLRT